MRIKHSNMHEIKQIKYQTSNIAQIYLSLATSMNIVSRISVLWSLVPRSFLPSPCTLHNPCLSASFVAALLSSNKRFSYVINNTNINCPTGDEKGVDEDERRGLECPY